MKHNATDEKITPAKVQIMGVGVTPFGSYRHAVNSIGRLIASQRQTFIAAINPEKIYRAQIDPELKSLLNNANITICDGIGVAIAGRVLNGKMIRRVTGVALFYELIQAAGKHGWKIFLLGAAPDVNEQARLALSAANPTLNIVGSLDGFFENSDETVATINKTGTDILFVAMGSPRQEVWIQKHRGKINALVLMGVGGTFDVVSGRIQRAPKIFRKTGTEWLYRLIREPKRFRRQLVLPKFVWLMVRHKLGKV